MGILFAVVSGGVAVAANVNSAFETGLDGWTLVGNGALSHQSSDGNPGGFAFWRDIAGPNGDGWAVAPAKFLGSWSSFTNNGVVRWDHRIINPDGTTIQNGRTEIRGPGGSAYYQSPTQMNSNWTTFSVPLKQSSWSLTSGTWTGLMNNVTNLRIRLEAVWGSGSDTDGIDNVLVGTTNNIGPVEVNIATAVEIYFNSVSNATHQVQMCTNLFSPDWINVGTSIPGDGKEKSVFDSTRSTPSKCYRVLSE